MGCDLAAALGSATVTGQTMVGVNHFGGGGELSLRSLPTRVHAVGEMVDHPRLRLAEVRQTARILGWSSPGSWGFVFGTNEHHVGIGVSRWKSRIPPSDNGLEGGDIVRLALERSTSARQGAEIVCDFIERFGQQPSDGDPIFLVADGGEALVVEAAGKHWAMLEVERSRAVCDVGLIRQDWRRLSGGLASHAIAQAWCQNDGSKIDFHASLADPNQPAPTGLKRWSRASLALTQQEGAIDPYCLRGLMLEHFEQCRDQLPPGERWRGSQIALLGGAGPAIVWASPAHLGSPLFFPLVPIAALPGVWIEGLPPLARIWRHDNRSEQSVLDRLQTHFDQDLETFLRDSPTLAPNDRCRVAQEMMARHVEMYLVELKAAPVRQRPKAAASDEMAAFISE